MPDQPSPLAEPQSDPRLRILMIVSREDALSLVPTLDSPPVKCCFRSEHPEPRPACPLQSLRSFGLPPVAGSQARERSRGVAPEGRIEATS